MQISSYLKLVSLLIASSLLLSACISRTNAIIVPPNNANGAAGGTKLITRNINAYAVSGQTTSLDNVQSLDPDCTVRQITIRISQKASHGTVTVATDERFPTFPAGNPRASCNTKKLPNHAINYTSQAGYIGSDTVGLEIFTTEGEEVDEKINIEVK